MRASNFFIGVFSVILFQSCSTGIPVDEQIEKIYAEAKSVFPESETKFLPGLRSGKLLAFNVSLPSEGKGLPCYIHLLMEYPENKMDSISMRAYETDIAYSFKDQYLLVLDYDPNEIEHFPNLKSIKDTLDLSPIPNFDFLQNGVWGTEYTHEATIYNLGWTRGASTDKQLLRRDRAGLPVKWEHGSTYGVTIWKNYVAYWIDMW